jgi:hypothetical protein
MDYPRTRTQKQTALRLDYRKDTADAHTLRRIIDAQIKRERRQREAD